jgi:hypothetical protein
MPNGFGSMARTSQAIRIFAKFASFEVTRREVEQGGAAGRDLSASTLKIHNKACSPQMHRGRRAQLMNAVAGAGDQGTSFAVKLRQPHDNLRCRIFCLTRVTRIFEKRVFTEIARWL